MSKNERKQTIYTDHEQALTPPEYKPEPKLKTATIKAQLASPLKRSKILIASTAIVVAIAATWFIRDSILYEHTDDAQIDGHIMRLSAQINGQVAQVNVIEGQLVHAGDVLAVMDPNECKIGLRRALANLAYAENTAASLYLNAAITVTTAYGGLNSAQAAVKNAAAVVEAANHKLQTDEAVLERVRTQDMPRQLFEAAVAADQQELLQVQAQLVQAITDLRNAQTAPQQVSLATAQAHAADSQILQRQAELEQAQLNLSYTIIRSPVTGIVGKRRIEVGQNASVGLELIDVVPLDDVWITANFKETQIDHIKPGQPVEIKVDAYDRTWKGHVMSVGGEAVSMFSLLTPENATGKHAKFVRRVPVRIDFDRPQKDFNAEGLLKPGLSAEPEVRVRWLPRTPSPPDRLPGRRVSIRAPLRSLYGWLWLSQWKSFTPAFSKPLSNISPVLTCTAERNVPDSWQLANDLATLSLVSFLQMS